MNINTFFNLSKYLKQHVITFVMYKLDKLGLGKFEEA